LENRNSMGISKCQGSAKQAIKYVTLAAYAA
jgi:hypothetical protein